jgi:hypothetical protein
MFHVKRFCPVAGGAFTQAELLQGVILGALEICRIENFAQSGLKR